MSIVFTFVLALLTSSLPLLNGATTSTVKDNNAQLGVVEDRSLNLWGIWTTVKDKVGTKLDQVANVIAEYPMKTAVAILDVVCSHIIKVPFLSLVPEEISPNISNINFQYITAHKNYSVPLMQAEHLWRHMAFNEQRKVVILATGWMNTVNDSQTLALLSNAFLCRKDVNFLIVDVGRYVDTLYKWASLNTRDIGHYVAEGLVKLVKVVPLRNIHLIGHSLGAHIMGTAGRHFYTLTGQMIPRITGLDPAKPCFWKNDTLHSLDRGDAVLVDIIHTNPGILGKPKPLGHIDFYPGGFYPIPPGCLDVSCAHSRAVEYFAESVYPGNERNFLGYKCSSLPTKADHDCTHDVRSTMGYEINTKATGIFYVGVNKQSPYGENIGIRSVIGWEKIKCT